MGWRFGIFTFSMILSGETFTLYLAILGLKEAFGEHLFEDRLVEYHIPLVFGLRVLVHNEYRLVISVVKKSLM